LVFQRAGGKKKFFIPIWEKENKEERRRTTSKLESCRFVQEGKGRENLSLARKSNSNL
jgi:hypothetical protein